MSARGNGGRGRTALLLSPHLDDVAFSCGGIAAALARSGWRVLVATAFTRSVHPASGFALACQRDKGLADTIDYMALRREEDRAACASLGAEPRLLDLPEAPNRGYGSAAALFAPPRREDDVHRELAPLLAGLVAQQRPALLLAPQGCGRHVDHLRLIEALLDPCCREPGAPPVLGFYRDTPYVIRDPGAEPDARVAAHAPHDVAVPIDDAARARKQEAVACYRSQLGYQFGDASRARHAIDALAGREAAGHGHAERLRAADPEALLSLLELSLVA